MNIYKVFYNVVLRGEYSESREVLITASSSEAAKLAVCIGFNVKIEDGLDVQLICAA